MTRAGLPIQERLFKHRKIDTKTACWLWTGSCNVKGYGKIRISNQSHLVHRISFMIFVEKIILNQILHKQECPNRNCFNPEHLYDGTPAENASDRMLWGKPKTLVHADFCKYGHPFNDENSMINEKTGQRICKQCHREWYQQLEIK